KLLDGWMDDPNSLIYQSIAPFDPFKEEFSVFKDKLDSAGDILGGATTGLENLHKMFPYTKATEITTKAVVSYGMRKLDTSVKWSENFFDTLGKQLSSNKTQVAMQMLGARYNLSKASVQNHSITTKTSKWINQAKRRAPTSSSNIKTRLVNNNGTLTLTETSTATKVAPKMSANLLREIGKLPLGAIVSYFHYINLSSAISSFSENKSGLNAANMLSALMGFAGAFGETALGLRGIANKTIPTNQIVARAAQNTIFKVLASKAFIRFTGFGGALIEAGTHVWNGFQLNSKGDKDAAKWSFAAGATLGAGGIMMTAGIIAGSLPGLGWVLAGALLIGVGIFCLFEKEDTTNTPFQIWLNRSCLGVNETKVGSPYSSVDQEAQGYAAVCYSARKLDELPESMQGKGVSKYAETDWHENYGWEDRVYFLVFLPGYDMNNSTAEVNLYAYDEWSVDEEDYNQATVLNTDTGVTVLSHAYHESGLVLYIDKPLKQSAADSVRLQVDYWPNKTTLNTKVTSNLFLDG
ncbi:hypothetical protein, partial [Kangiella shandongensis]|uniref:hypothetical protein n=1 Tax=Kangiella shandongensis TaxID=2763258 RepID=UPI001CBC4799